MRQARTFARVAVDVTALGPGGENGGSRLVTTELVRQFSRLAPDVQFVLLTNMQTRDELADLDAPNVQRECVLVGAAHARLPVSRLRTIRHRVRDRLRWTLGPTRLASLQTLYWSWRYHSPRTTTLHRLDVDLYFCPLTYAFCRDENVPTVAIVYDLQHTRFPDFFLPEQRLFRQHQLDELCRRAERVVCISEHVRQSLLASQPIDADRVITQRLPLLRPLVVDPAAVQCTLARVGLGKDGFFLYPANFWPHKNHAVLLEAFAQFRAEHPASRLVLACTGMPGPGLEEFRRSVAERGLTDEVRLPGYLDEAPLAALFNSCRALVYPSLYEGFGMPVLEAMACGKPVMCSDVGSLPEVSAGDALLFDPTQPGEIAAAMARVAGDGRDLRPCIERGYQRVHELGSAEDMARAYLSIFDEVASRAAESAVA